MSTESSRVFVTGSVEGLGLMAAQLLAKQGHRVTLHARNASRASDARRALPAAEHVVVGDLETLAGMRAVANAANATGAFDAVIHNAAIGYALAKRAETADGLERHFAINVLAPYVLTALVKRPKRLVYLSSGMHQGGTSSTDDLQWTKRRWSGSQAYSDTKLLDVVLAFGIARLWPDVLSNALEPGWVATKMGGAGAPDDLTLGGVTQAWLAVSDAKEAKVTGSYFFHQKLHPVKAAARDVGVQDALIAECARLAGVALP